MQESKLMTRRKWICAALTLNACHEKEAPVDLFPETIANVWRRVSLQELPVSDAPDPIPREGLKRLQLAAYEGPGKLEARAYELTQFSVGLDMAQRWHPSADTVFFNEGRYFVVVKWQEADRKALHDFVRGLVERASGRPHPHSQ